MNLQVGGLIIGGLASEAGLLSSQHASLSTTAGAGSGSVISGLGFWVWDGVGMGGWHGGRTKYKQSNMEQLSH